MPAGTWLWRPRTQERDGCLKARAQAAMPLKDPQTRAGALYLLACLAKKEDDGDTAVHYFQELLAIEPNSPVAHAELGLLFLRRDEIDAARRDRAGAGGGPAEFPRQ